MRNFNKRLGRPLAIKYLSQTEFGSNTILCQAAVGGGVSGGTRLTYAQWHPNKGLTTYKP